MKNEAKIHETKCPEIETIAALLDGRLKGDERGRVIEHLGQCDACYEVFTETRRFQEEETEKGKVLVHPATWRKWIPAATAMAAAMLLMVLAVPMWRAFQGGVSATEAGRLAENLVSTSKPSELVPLAYSGDGWSRTRGVGTGLNDRQRFFRLGVRTVDLELALRAGDAERATLLLHELSNLARDLPLPETILVSYDDLMERLERGEAPDSLTQRSAAAASLIPDAAEAPYLELGQWAEAGLLAAISGDADFFDRSFVRTYPEALKATELPEDLRAPLTTISAQLDQRVDDGDLASLTEAFTELVESGGNA
ncbi:MAG: zf-HC2 domain-containing protein [Thermoanaerobaculia bacterium]